MNRTLPAITLKAHENNVKNEPKKGQRTDLRTSCSDTAFAIINIDPNQRHHRHEGQSHSTDMSKLVSGAKNQPRENQNRGQTKTIQKLKGIVEFVLRGTGANGNC